MDAWTLPLIIPPGRTDNLITLLGLKEFRLFITLNSASLKKEVIVKRFTCSAIVVCFYDLKERLDPEMAITSHVASELTSE